MKTGLALLLGLAAAQSWGATDTLILNAQSISFEEETPDGATKSVDWIRKGEGNRLVGLGASEQEFGDARLRIARFTGGLDLSPRNAFTTMVEGGVGETGAEPYGFFRGTAEATRRITPTLRITGGGQYVEAGSLRAVLLRAESTWAPHAALSLRVQAAHTVGGNLPTRLATVRADYVKRVQVYGGMSLGEGTQSPIEFGRVDYEQFTGVFLGAAVPLSRCMLGLTWDRFSLQDQDRSTATLTFAVVLP